MKIRLIGTDAECAAALTDLRYGLLVRVNTVDGPYFTRRDTNQMRLELDVDLASTPAKGDRT